MQEEIHKMTGNKSHIISTDFTISSTNEQSLAEILEVIDKTNDIICFSDMKGRIWEVVNMPDFSPENFISNIEETPHNSIE